MISSPKWSISQVVIPGFKAFASSSWVFARIFPASLISSISLADLIVTDIHYAPRTATISENTFHILCSVNICQYAGFLIIVNQRLCLIMIHGQTLLNGFRLIVIS